MIDGSADRKTAAKMLEELDLDGGDKGVGAAADAAKPDDDDDLLALMDGAK